MNLSKNFTLDEFVKSQSAIRKGIDNTPTPEVIAALTLVCEYILEPVRKNFKKPVKVSSGYRSPKLNAAIGGAKNSQHVLGQAVDFEVPGVSNYEVAKWVSENCLFDQVILEFYTHGDPNSGWVHASYNRSGNRFEKLTATSTKTTFGNKTVYSKGLNP